MMEPRFNEGSERRMSVEFSSANPINDQPHSVSATPLFETFPPRGPTDCHGTLLSKPKSFILHITATVSENLCIKSTFLLAAFS